MKMHKNFGLIKLICLCLLVGIIGALPTLSLYNKKNDFPVRENFVGETSSYQGVINVWNVDTFEGGSCGKSDFLESKAIEFSNLKTGALFLIRNITPEELENSLNSGVLPDIISFGFGVGDKLKDFLIDLKLEVQPIKSVLSSGTWGESLLAAGYLMGGYILASTSQKLSNAGKDANISLVSEVDSAGYESKKSRVHSLVVGENKFINPKKAIYSNYEAKLTDVKIAESMYDAYLEFVAYNAGTILLGTHRDLFKLSGKVASGQLEDIIISPLGGYTDLVQYIGIIRGELKEKTACCMEFINYLFSDNVQQDIATINMFSTTGLDIYETGEFNRLEELLKQDLVIPNIFV